MRNISKMYFKKIKEDVRVEKILINSGASFFSKGVNLILNILSVPLLLTHLGSERYGMFALVTFFVGLLNFSDLGLSLGLQNKLPLYINEVNPNKATSAIISSFYILVIVSITLLIISIACVWIIDWSLIFNVTSRNAKTEASNVALAFFICFFIGMPFTIGSTILTGLQKSFISEIFKSIGNIFIIIFMYLAVWLNFSTVIFIYIYYGVIAFSGILITWYVFFKYEPKWKPKLTSIDFPLIKYLLSDSSKYFFMQLLSLGLLTFDGFFVAHYEGAESVSGFMVGIRLVTILNLPAVLINSQFLPALNDAAVKKDGGWIKSNLRKVFIFNFIYGFVILIIMFTLRNILLYKWVGPLVSFSNFQWAGFGFLFIFTLFNSIISTILLSPIFINFKIIIFTISVLLMILVKWLTIFYFNSTCMLIAGSVTMIVLYFLPAIVKIKSLNYI